MYKIDFTKPIIILIHEQYGGIKSKDSWMYPLAKDCAKKEQVESVYA